MAQMEKNSGGFFSKKDTGCYVYKLSSTIVPYLVVEKIAGFADLKKGWHFGEGTRPDDITINMAKDFARKGLSSLFDVDAFPGIDGEIMVSIYHGHHYLECVFEKNETVTYTYEIKGQEVAYHEGLSIEEAFEKLDTFRRKIWNTSESSISSIMIAGAEGFRALPLEIHRQGEGSQPYRLNALENQGFQFVSILNSFTQRLLPRQQFFFDSP